MQGRSAPSRSPAAQSQHSHHFAHSAPANIPFINRVLSRDLGCGDTARPAAQTGSLTGERPSWAGCLVFCLTKSTSRMKPSSTSSSRHGSQEAVCRSGANCPKFAVTSVMEGRRICAGRFSDPDRGARESRQRPMAFSCGFGESGEEGGGKGGRVRGAGKKETGKRGTPAKV